MKARTAGAVVLVLMWSGDAAAHLVSTRFGDLYSGALHPLTTLQHLVPWLGLALLGALQPTTTARWSLLIFPLGLICGLLMAKQFPAIAMFEPINLGSFAVIGLMVAFRIRLSMSQFALLVALLAISHGYANAAMELSGYHAVLYTTGLALTGYLLITLVTASCKALAEGPAWGSIALRAIGSWIAAIGLVYSGFLLVPH